MPELKCPNCGATEGKKGTFENKAALMAHINIHCPKKPSKPARGATKNGHTCKYVLLNHSHPAMSAAIAKGYTQICHGCGDIE